MGVEEIMGICFRCGAIVAKGDVHTCKPENIPAQGKEKVPTTTELSK